MYLSRLLSCAAVVCLAACQNAQPVSFAKPKAPSANQMAQALNGTGYSGSAQFSAPVIDPNTWQGTPIGTGSWSAQSTPAQSGGNQAIGAVDTSQPGQTFSYVVIGDFTQSTGKIFAVISDQPFAVGTAQIDNQHLYAGVFDGTTGEPTALADSGTVTFTQVGGVGGTIAGSFSGSLDDVTSTPPPACTSNADCAAGQVCTAGRCVTAPPPPPTCTTNADCAANQACVNGACVPNSTGCTSNAQCPAGSTCQGGACVVAPPPACTVDADCGPNMACRGGTCYPASTGGSCQAQGTGAYSGSATTPMSCSALGNGAVSLTNGMAFIGDDQTGSGLALYIFDQNGSPDGVILPINACPSAPGAVQVSGQVYSSAPNAGAGLQLIAIHDAAGSINFTGVGHYTGTFTLSLTGGGNVSGTFDVQ
jgi:Cys-rich repeat protein